jgi:excisionase family DNA binding protein
MMQILNIKELSQLLSVKEKTLYQWVALQQIPHIKLNGSLRFDIEDIRQWISSCKKNPVSGYNPFVQTRGPRKGGKK